MMGLRKRSFACAHQLLRTLRADLNDLGVLWRLQKKILGEIKQSEKKVRKLKARLGASGKDESNQNEGNRSALEAQIDDFRQAIYIWRCFGDAIAFLYLDKYSLKQTYFSTKKRSIKQSAGFLLGKEGISAEIALVRAALQGGVPALLTDLTNTIRYGDVCLMIGPDPYLVESKASGKLNSRGTRQQQNLRQVMSFLQNDVARDLRGYPLLRRSAAQVPEKSYLDVLNECILEAMTVGSGVRTPEPGIHYIASTPWGPEPQHLLDWSGFKKPWVFLLNGFKSGRQWLYYLPFILTINEKVHLWHFICGTLFLTIVLETNILEDLARRNGCTVKMLSRDDDFPVRMLNAEGREIGVSEQMLARVAFECVSLEWIFRVSTDHLNSGFFGDDELQEDKISDDSM